MGKKTSEAQQFAHLRIGAVVLVICMLANSISLLAKTLEAPQQDPQPQNEQNKNQGERAISKEEEKLWMKQIEIYGQIAKPQTVFIIPGTDPRVDGLRIDRHFFSHIFRPVEKSTLKRIQAKQGKDKEHILW